MGAARKRAQTDLSRALPKLVRGKRSPRHPARSRVVAKPPSPNRYDASHLSSVRAWLRLSPLTRSMRLYQTLTVLGGHFR